MKYNPHDTNNIPYGYCHCGCGQKTKIATQTIGSRGQVKGEPIRYILGHGTSGSLLKRFWERVDVQGRDECWEWQAGKYPFGHGTIMEKGKQLLAHRIAWEIANNQEVPEGMYILHSCDNPSCCNPAHLRPGTAADNVHDMYERGRGKQRNNVHLTWEQVREIRQAYADGETQVSLAAKFDITQANVSRIVRGETWIEE